MIMDAEEFKPDFPGHGIETMGDGTTKGSPYIGPGITPIVALRVFSPCLEE